MRLVGPVKIPMKFSQFFVYFRCTKSGLKEIQCPSGLAFDIMKQTCDWKAKVTNCNEKESKSTQKLLQITKQMQKLSTLFGNGHWIYLYKIQQQQKKTKKSNNQHHK